MSQLDILAGYRDRAIRVLTEVRAVGCVTDECRDVVADGVVYEIAQTVSDVAEGLATIIGALQRAIDAHRPCQHDETHPYLPPDYERPVSGVHQCNACGEVLVEMKCMGCDVQVLPHEVATHLAGHSRGL